MVDISAVFQELDRIKDNVNHLICDLFIFMNERMSAEGGGVRMMFETFFAMMDKLDQHGYMSISFNKEGDIDVYLSQAVVPTQKPLKLFTMEKISNCQEEDPEKEYCYISITTFLTQISVFLIETSRKLETLKKDFVITYLKESLDEFRHKLDFVTNSSYKIHQTDTGITASVEFKLKKE